MKKALTKILTALLMLTVLFASMPVTLIAEGISGIEKVGNKENGENNVVTSTTGPGYIELTDGYIKVRVSTKNGGYYVGTDEGDVLLKSDNNKDLVYSDESFDTSFTSFRVKRGNEVNDYIFGRDYSFKGKETSPLSVIQNADNAITAEWSVDGILFRQTIALMGADTYQHGMAYISYSVVNMSKSEIDSIEARVMMDTALGMKDYGYYMLGQDDGSYVDIKRERTVSGTEYSNYFFAYDDLTSPTVTAYTLNASVAGEMIVPSKVTFAHWANLASSIFDYQVPGANPPNFTMPTGSEHLTADSAVALYYEMGGAAAESDGGHIALYYGVYSNYNAGDADVALNYTTTGSMFFDSTGTAYKDINSSLPGNFSTTVKLQNISEATINKLAVAIYPEEQVIPHDGSDWVTDISPVKPYYKTVEELKAGEVVDVRFDMLIDPTLVTGYRKIRVVVYNISNLKEITLTDENTVIEDEIYVLCPGAESADLSFMGMTPDTVFHRGTRICYVTGSNFGLIRDKTQYRILLRPANGGEDTVLDMDRVVINTELNIATLVIDQTLEKTTYQVVIDWNDLTVEDIAPETLKITVTDVPSPGDPGYVSSGMYGIVTVERDGTSYDIVNYPSEDAYLNTRTAKEDIMLVMRGDFNVLSTDEKGRYSAEALTLLNGEHIVINDTLEIRNGRVTVTKRFDGEKQTAIDVDIDGKVYAIGSNTKVWDGVLAITSFNEGTLYSLPVYNEEGEMSEDTEGEAITLLWPGSAGGMQTLVGLLLNFRYGQFCLMEQDGELARVISFGASLDPSILVPSGMIADKKHYSKMEAQYRELGMGQYTAEQLRATDTQYAKDQSQWRREQSGSLNLYMDDILFGAGGFIGFNTSIEVGIPSYTDPLPYISGTLTLKVINDYWEFGVDGTADMMVFEMEVELLLKSYNGIPVPDTIRFFVGGIEPGIPIDPFGVFWVKGAGAGISDMYETFFGTDVLPPLTLMLSGEFALFSQISARADIGISMQGLSGYMKDLSIAGITLIDSLGGHVYWYPEFSISFAIRIDILDCIIGEGGIILEETEDGMYFCAYASATVKIPDYIWFIGGKKIGSAAVGVSTEKVWASVSIIGISVGVRYYWGESVKIDIGASYDVPTPLSNKEKNDPESLSYPVYTDTRTGKTLYMSLTTLSASTGIDDTEIVTSSDATHHTFTLPENTGEDALIGLRFSAENEMMAEDLKNLVSLTVDGNEYPLVWYNDDFTADHEENEGTNAIFGYDEESKTASVSVSVVDDEFFGKEIELSSSVYSTVKLIGVERVADLYTAEISSELDSVKVTGKSIDKLSGMKILAENSDGAFYLLADVDTALFLENEVTAPITAPLNMQSGEYTLKAVGTMLDSDGVEIASPMASTEFSYVNSNQPKAPSHASIALSGDYTVTLTTTTDTPERDGFITTVWEISEDGRVATEFFEQRYELSFENKDQLSHSIRLGGRTSNVTKNENGAEITVYSGLEAGKKYAVSVAGYVNMSDGSILMSTPVFSNEVMMVMPTKVSPEFSIDGSVSLEVGNSSLMIDTVSDSTPVIKVLGTENIGTASYRIDDGAAVQYLGGDIQLSALESGIYTLTLEGVSKTNDSFSTKYQFSVDTEAPSLLLSQSENGGFFYGNSTVISGITDAFSTVDVYVEGEHAVSVTADGSGAFSVNVPLDESLAYQTVRVLSLDAVGNVSMPFGLTLTNSVLGEENIKAVVFYEGKEVKTLVSGTEPKDLNIAFRLEDRYVTLNADSTAAATVVWSTQMIHKTASVSSDGILTCDNGAEGVITATVANKTAMVELVSVDIPNENISVRIPEGGLVYTGEKIQPEVVFEDRDDLVENTDYTVSYVNNVDVGIASAIITATEDGKCVGSKIINFTISPCSVDILEVVASGKGDSVKLTVKHGERALSENTDYTVKITTSSDGKETIAAITGIGNYTGVKSIRINNETFNHAVWIIPVATVSSIGIAFGVLMLLKYLRRRKLK